MPQQETDFHVDSARQAFRLPRGRALLDNAAASAELIASRERALAFSERCRVQLGGAYRESRLADRALGHARRQLARFVGAPAQAALIPGTSVTMLLEQLAQGIGRDLAVGDEVIVTELDHGANRFPWLALAERGIVIRRWRPRPPDWTLAREDLEELFTSRTRLVCVTHASNVTGAISPLAEITASAHRHGAAVCADGTAYVPHRAVDLQELGVDFYVFSFFKAFGPQLALLTVAPQAWRRLSHAARAHLPSRGYSYAALFAAAAVPAHFRDLAPQGGGSLLHPALHGIARHEARLTRRLRDWLETIPELSLLGPEDDDPDTRVAIVAVTGGADLPARLDRHGLAVRFGQFNCAALFEQVGASAALRISLAHYNTVGEIDALGQALQLETGSA